MDLATQRTRASGFASLHAASEPLLLVNAWDAGSARLFEQIGCSAIATSSAGVAWVHGRADGERLERGVLLSAVERIACAVELPVSVDIERGYGRVPREVCETVDALLDAGAVGVNIEDGMDESGDALVQPGALSEKIAAIRALSDSRGIPLFINARTDAWLLPTRDAGHRFDEAITRLNEYAAAGADGLFAPGLSDLSEIERAAAALPRPLNVYAGGPDVPSVRELARVGVRRISLGCGPLQALLGLARRIANELLSDGSYAEMTRWMLPVGELNGVFSSEKEKRS